MSERHGNNWQEEHGDDPSVWNEVYGKPNHGKLYLIRSLVDKSIVRPHRRRSATTTISTPSATTYSQEHVSRLDVYEGESPTIGGPCTNANANADETIVGYVVLV